MNATSKSSVDVAFVVNGSAISDKVAPRTTLVDFLRQRLGLTGSHVGCEHGVCGACHVRVDGTVLRGCLFLAVQADGAEVQTIEGLSAS
ncbi:MAG TPA: 2Fe-2S iron-sulfur cluster-binding protein, partial [Steroidobacteraceae bacterium]|nr:2Fe-2S iron-sulfur cluster-binding protein [Steroidobacteraceae bacterium]